MARSRKKSARRENQNQSQAKGSDVANQSEMTGRERWVKYIFQKGGEGQVERSLYTQKGEEEGKKKSGAGQKNT